MNVAVFKIKMLNLDFCDLTTARYVTSVSVPSLNNYSLHSRKIAQFLLRMVLQNGRGINWN